MQEGRFFILKFLYGQGKNRETIEIKKAKGTTGLVIEAYWGKVRVYFCRGLY